MHLTLGSRFPHVVRSREDYVDFPASRAARASAPCIRTLPGDWRTWHEASMPAYVELPVNALPATASRGRWWHFPSFSPNDIPAARAAVAAGYADALQVLVLTWEAYAPTQIL